MCGIFFSASKRQLTRPECLGTLGSRDASGFVLELSSTEVAEIIENDLNQDTILSPQDAQKVQNLEKLRKLQEKLSKSKNKDDVQLEIDMLNHHIEEPVKTSKSLVDKIIPKVVARGPDYVQYREFTESETNFQLLSSVLSLRQPFSKQPEIGSDFILQFNGELYNDGCMECNDVDYVMAEIKTAFASLSRESAILHVLSQLNGEFAFVLLDLAEKKIYFGKDYVGKRSLLYRLEPDAITIASVLPDKENGGLTECVSNQIHVVNYEDFKLRTIPYQNVWSTNESNQRISIASLSAIARSAETSLQARVNTLHHYLSRACEVRQNTIHPLSGSGEVELGVLFSGGLDCTVLAHLIATNYVNKQKSAVIDLMTVGFENPRTGMSPDESPDRQLSVRSWIELSRKFSGSCVKFRLVQIDVGYVEWLSNKARVLDLIYPCSTVMDLSIAIAFYFASKAKDCTAMELDESVKGDNFQIEDCVKIENYTSVAKVLFSGLGADELFGGYSRHENIFHSVLEGQTCDSQYEELADSLVHDILIIYERNLGRDDRAVSSWGKELRYPYLDNGVINFALNEVEPQLKMNFEWHNQITKKGEKRVKVFSRKYILRQLAHNLGLPLAAEEIKRAIQFGAKSAKMEIGQSKTRGTEKLL